MYCFGAGNRVASVSQRNSFLSGYKLASEPCTKSRQFYIINGSQNAKKNRSNTYPDSS